MRASTAEQILDAAQLLVQQRGYHAVSYADIAGLVGIRKASIHYYYPSKADLAEALLARARALFETTLDETARTTESPREALAAFAALFRDTLAGGDRLCPFCVLATAQDTVPEPVQAQVRAFWESAEHWLADRLRECLPPARVLPVARTVVATLEGAMITARAFGEPTRLEEAIACLEALVFGDTTQGEPAAAAAGARRH